MKRRIGRSPTGEPKLQVGDLITPDTDPPIRIRYRVDSIFMESNDGIASVPKYRLIYHDGDSTRYDVRMLEGSWQTHAVEDQFFYAMNGVEWMVRLL